MKTSLYVLSFVMGLLGSAIAFAVEVKVESATMGRKGSTTASIEIKVYEITAEDRGAALADAFIKEHIAFSFPNIPNPEEESGCADADEYEGKPIKYDGGNTPGTIPDFRIDNLSVGDGFVEEATDEDTYYIKATMTLVDEGGSCGFSVMVKDTSTIPMEVEYDEEGAEEFELTQQVGVPKVAPEGFTVASSHLALVLDWTHKDKVSYEPTGTFAPSNVVALAIDMTMRTEVPFEAKIFDPTLEEGQEEDATECHFTIVADGCEITCDDANAYIDVESISTGNGVFKAQFPHADSPDGGYEISGLTLDHRYGVFAMYQPDGIARTTCKTGVPSYVDGICDRNKCNESEQTTPKCFVATAAYGSPMHRHIETLRWFRDTYLAKTKIGRDFIDYYYEVGPGWAKMIEDSPVARALVRGALWPIVMLLMLLQYSPMAAYSVLIMFGAILLYSCARFRRLRI